LKSEDGAQYKGGKDSLERGTLAESPFYLPDGIFPPELFL